MIHIFLSRIGWFVLLLLLQALVFNHIHFFGYATPMPYVYFLLLLPTNASRWVYLLLGFCLGLAVDLFSGTPGMNAASLCFTALLAPSLITVFAPMDRDADAFVPSFRSMGWAAYLRLAATAVFINTFAYFLVESFTFSDWALLLKGAGSSTLLTFFFVATMEYIRMGSKRH